MSSEPRSDSHRERARFLRFVALVLVLAGLSAGVWFTSALRATRAELSEAVASLQERGLLPAETESEGAAEATEVAEGPSRGAQTLAALARLCALDRSGLQGEPSAPGEAAEPREPAAESASLAEARALALGPRLRRADFARAADEQSFELPPTAPVRDLLWLVQLLADSALREAQAGNGPAAVADLEAGLAAAALVVELDWWQGALLWVAAERQVLEALHECLPELEGEDLSGVEQRLVELDPIQVGRAALLGETAWTHRLLSRMERGELRLEGLPDARPSLPGIWRWALERDHIEFLELFEEQLRELESASLPEQREGPSRSISGLTELLGTQWDSVLRAVLGHESERRCARAALMGQRLGAGAALEWLESSADPNTGEPFAIVRGASGRARVASSVVAGRLWDLGAQQAEEE